MKRILKVLIGRRLLVVVLILFQVWLITYTIVNTSSLSKILSDSLTIVSVFSALYVIGRKDCTAAYKTSWVFTILVLPLFGGLLYILIACQASTKRFKKGILKLDDIYFNLIKGDAERGNIETSGITQASQIKYLQDHVGYPVYKNTETDYFSPGEKFFDDLMREIENTEKYIFIEYFVIEKGRMWDRILEVLERKVHQGIEVRVIYDDLGSLFSLPMNYDDILRAKGIKCIKFNPFKPVLSATQNNRDHRKIFSIDGKIAYTGGINLADEYINSHKRFGHWKDTAVKIKGDAAWSLTAMFISMWDLSSGVNDDPRKYRPYAIEDNYHMSDGYVQPYSDSPLDNERIGEQVYLNIINQAKKYVHINTPYLVIGDTMQNALTSAAKRGIDVRIVTPHIPDKKMVFATTRSYYATLISAGVKIYEYTPGFMHSKNVVSDDEVAAIGTINFDFRSFNLQFECGICFYGSSVVREAEKDFLETLKVCAEIKKKASNQSFIVGLYHEVLHLFAPLM